MPIAREIVPSQMIPGKDKYGFGYFGARRVGAKGNV